MSKIKSKILSGILGGGNKKEEENLLKAKDKDTNNNQSINMSILKTQTNQMNTQKENKDEELELENLFNENHEVYYINQTPINKEIYNNLKGKVQNKIEVKKYYQLNEEEKKYYVLNYYNYKTIIIQTLEENSVKLEDAIEKNINKMKKENTNFNIFEKPDKREENAKLEVEIKKVQKNIDEIQNKIDRCDQTINNYSETSSELLKTNITKKYKSRLLKNHAQTESKLSIDDMILKLKQEKQRLRENKKIIHNNIVMYEDLLKQLNESISILEIKPKSSIEDKGEIINNFMINKDVFAEN